MDCRSGIGVSTGESVSVGTGDQRTVGKGARALPLVHAVAPSRYPDQVRAIHQAGHPGMRAGSGMGSRPAPAVGRQGAGRDFEDYSQGDCDSAEGSEARRVIERAVSSHTLTPNLTPTLG